MKTKQEQNFCILRKLFLFLTVYFFSLNGYTQSCSDFDFTYITTASSCVSNGSITITVKGGKGPFNYWVSGPVTPPVTSSNFISGLAPGAYTVYVQDLASGGCGITTKPNIVVLGSYTSPNFLLNKTDVSCLKNDGSISVTGVSGGKPPFVYTVVAPSTAQVGVSSATGVFSNLTPGDYYVQLQDNCGNLQQRSITVLDFTWNVSVGSVTKAGCDSADAVISLQDNKGNDNTSSTDFSGFLYGVVQAPGDTLWFSTNSFRFYRKKRLSGELVIKDPCGTSNYQPWSLPPNQVPSAGIVLTSQYNCDSTFIATATGVQGMNQPSYCVYNKDNDLMGCNTTGMFSNLHYGDYCMKITDGCGDTVITRCFSSNPPKPAIDDAVAMSAITCSVFNIWVTGKINLSGATYCLVKNGPTYDTVDCNTNGIFNNIPFGNYCIKVQANPFCFDTIITRCFTTVRPIPIVNSIQLKSLQCNTIIVDTLEGRAGSAAQFCLYNASGNVVECNNTGVFSNVLFGDYCIRAISPCGDTSQPYCFNTRNNIPNVGNNVFRTNRTCATFTAYLDDTSKLVNPIFSLYDNNNNLVQQNTSGIFTQLPYGSYCLQVKNDPTCFDTTFVRCFTENRPPISLSATLSQSNATCSYFTATITGSGLTNPIYYLTNTGGDTLAANSTGVFNNLGYGRYCALVRDGCDTTLKICQDFEPLHGIQLSSWISCTPNSGVIAAQMISKNNPFNFYFYDPSGHLLYSILATWSGWQSVTLPALPAGGQYKVVGEDNCGRRDSSYIVPQTNTLVKSISVRQRCLSGTWPNGSSDITISSYSTPFGTATPHLIKKDGSSINQNYSSQSGNTYIFLNLGPATYVVEYSISGCSEKAYDTVRVDPYQIPVLSYAAIYQCDINGFTASASASKGAGPYQYEIIGSTPSSPSILTGPQLNGTFYINNGTTYSLIRLRVTDACGNAALNDASVLPLGNIIVSTSSDCLLQPATLSVTTIPNATYQWYKFTSPIDSSLIGSGPDYSIPFTTNNDLGVYLCKTSINTNCLTRLSYIELKGNCNNILLSLHAQLSGKRRTDGIFLNWDKLSGDNIYQIERQTEGETGFVPIGDQNDLVTTNGSMMSYLDHHPFPGANAYRIRVNQGNAGSYYTNTVMIKAADEEINIYPNPIISELSISFNMRQLTNYSIALIDMNGRSIFLNTVKVGDSKLFKIKRPQGLQTGVYIVRISNLNTGISKSFKLYFK